MLLLTCEKINKSLCKEATPWVRAMNKTKLLSLYHGLAIGIKSFI